MDAHTAVSHLSVCLQWLCGTTAAHIEESGPDCDSHTAAAGGRSLHAGVYKHTQNQTLFSLQAFLISTLDFKTCEDPSTLKTLSKPSH